MQIAHRQSIVARHSDIRASNDGSAKISDARTSNPRREEEFEGPSPKIHEGRQDKHIVGTNNFIPGRSELTANPVELGRRAGTGQQLGDTPVGDPGSRERVDFGRNIGNVVNPKGESAPTSVGNIHYGKDGIHIVPAWPK